MAQGATQLFPRNQALLIGVVPFSIDSVGVPAAEYGQYTVPVDTGIVLISTSVKCTFRDSLAGSVSATLPTSGATNGEESAWLHPGESRAFRVHPGQAIQFHGDGTTDAMVTIERYVGTNATLPPD